MSPQNLVADQNAIRDNKLTLVERLADDLAHEIKNPLHSMVINLEVLRRRIGGLPIESHDELLRYTRILGAELDRINRRVDLLLQMVRPKKDSDDPATLAEIFDELREILELECERQGVTLHAPSPPLSVNSRYPRASTRQMILGVTLKTLDSLPRGGTIDLSVELKDGRVLIRCSGTAPNGASAAGLPAAVDDSYINVARDLARALDGDLEMLTVATTTLSASPTPASQYLLSLPAVS